MEQNLGYPLEKLKFAPTEIFFRIQFEGSRWAKSFEKDYSASELNRHQILYSNGENLPENDLEADALRLKFPKDSNSNTGLQ